MPDRRLVRMYCILSRVSLSRLTAFSDTYSWEWQTAPSRVSQERSPARFRVQNAAACIKEVWCCLPF